MKSSAEFVAIVREGTGTGAARELRRQGRIPAIVYSKDGEPAGVHLEEKVLKLEYYKGGFFNKIVTLNIGKEKVFALPKDLQFHPVTDRIEHADFLRVDEKSEIRVRIPLRFINTDRCIGIKRGGSLNIVRHDIELFAPANNIPPVIEIDLLSVNIGDSVHIEAIELPKGTRPTITRNFTIVAVAGRATKEEASK